MKIRTKTESCLRRIDQTSMILQFIMKKHEAWQLQFVNKNFLPMLRLVVFIALSFFTVSCYAQFSDTVHYYLRYSSTGIINHTNDASSYVLTNSLNFNTKKKNVVINTSASWVYGQLQNTLTNN